MARPAPRRGTIRFSSARKSEFVWDTHDLNGDIIMKYDQATMNLIKARLRGVRAAVEAHAKSLADDKWTSHPDRHPSFQYPHRKTAKEGLFASLQGGDARHRVIRLQLQHHWLTIYRDLLGTINYGVELETMQGGRFAVINETLQAYQDDFMAECAFALNDTAKLTPDDFGGAFPF